VEEDDEGNASVGNGEVLMGGNIRSIGLINEKKQCLKSHFIFSSIHHKMKFKNQSFYQRICILTVTCFPICVDLVKYVLAQATDWCAGFLVRV